MSVPRSVLEQAIREGGTVLLSGNHPHAGTIIRRAEDLPSELEFAQAAGDSDHVAALLAQKEADLAAAQAELDALRAQLGDVTGPTGAGNPSVITKPEPEPEPTELRARLEALTVAELRAEAAAANITVPASVERKVALIDFLLAAAKE